MPRGDNPNSRKNLEKNQHLSSKEVRERGSKGGRASAESRRISASLTEALKGQLTEELMDELALMLIRRAKQGNLKAWELIRDQLGEKPADKKEVTFAPDPNVMERLQEAIKKRQYTKENEK